MKPFLEIRTADLPDLETIRDLAERTWRHSYPGIISDDQIDYMLGWMYSPSRLREEMTASDIIYLIAETKASGRSRLVPTGFAAYGPSDQAAKTTAFLHKLYVLPDHQGRGIGSALLLHIEQSLLEDRVESLELRVNRGNHDAVKVYESHGFLRVAEICDEIGGGFVMDDYLMCKKLSRDSSS